jgi:hypothetical protein
MCLKVILSRVSSKKHCCWTLLDFVGSCSRVNPILTCEVQQQFSLLLAHVEKETGQRNETSTMVEDSAIVILAF